MGESARSGAQGSIVSDFAGDPEMGELVQLFVSELPQRVEALRSAWAGKQVETLARLAHQLRGASAGYGFPTIGKSAERLELDIRKLDRRDAGEALASIAGQFKDLVDLCNRVRSAA
jgi:HPt (histidine-containing phosphotransfer) domain-containing protein